jgi:DNA helicase-2/ATP-dependent DNA helicase PcrA
LTYEDGKMGVSAVPGSGKTQILSYLAAKLVSQGLSDDQEVLVVTFSNSAVNTFVQRITQLIRQEYQLLPHIGYRVRTLHGLAHDIVRERPAIAGLSEQFQILDERVTGQMREEAVQLWIREYPYVLEQFISSEVDDRGLDRILRRQWPDLAFNLADKFISRAKDLQLSPTALRLQLSEALDGQPLDSQPLLQMGLQVYEDYQRALSYQGGVDFDDLVRLALQVVQTDPELLNRLRHRWPYILEDEAQDSSYLQEQILRLLTHNGNWVRVGDPNQAINTTFTTADPYFLRQFLKEEDVVQHVLPNSGRSTLRIIELANYLIDWTSQAHPSPWLRQGPTAAFLPQDIVPTPPGDPQPNPVDLPAYTVHLHNQEYEPDQELHDVVRSLARWLPAHPDRTVAVLVPINARGFKLAELLRRRDLPHEELLRSTAQTRQTAGILESILRYLGHPLQPENLARAFLIWSQVNPLTPLETAHPMENAVASMEEEEGEEGEQDTSAVEAWREQQRKKLARVLRRCRDPESFVYPRPGADYVAALDLDEESMVPLLAFRQAVQRWLEASILPIDQLVLTLAQELFTEPADLALSYKLALLLGSYADHNPEARLPDLVQELAMIARNQRRFLGFDEADLGYEPKPGVVTISTMHKAKGLEWDRVYLVGVNNYNFPSAEPHDYYRGESWFIQDQLNLEAEAVAQLELLHEGKLSEYMMGEATEKALIITWNRGHATFEKKVAAAPFIALHTYWEEHERFSPAEMSTVTPE